MLEIMTEELFRHSVLYTLYTVYCTSLGHNSSHLVPVHMLLFSKLYLRHILRLYVFVFHCSTTYQAPNNLHRSFSNHVCAFVRYLPRVNIQNQNSQYLGHNQWMGIAFLRIPYLLQWYFCYCCVSYVCSMRCPMSFVTEKQGQDGLDVQNFLVSIMEGILIDEPIFWELYLVLKSHTQTLCIYIIINNYYLLYYYIIYYVIIIIIILCICIS